MKIVLSGVETNNKGAELMFYAILQEIERKFPDAVVYVEPLSVPQGLRYLKTSLKIKEKPFSCVFEFCKKYHIYGILSRFHLPIMPLEDIYAISKADYFLDGSGFHFSDRWDYTDHAIERRCKLWEATSKEGTRIIFLPQAFGPFEKTQSRKYLGIMAKYADLIIAREEVSYNYLTGSKVVDMKKVKLYPDFTSLVKGVIPPKFCHLSNSVCIIPNYNMIESGSISLDGYLNIMISMIDKVRRSGKKAFILNHEGEKDELLAFNCNNLLDDKVEIVSGLNALEVKGLLSTAYLVISSRFHGVVSSLNSCVPCLATSWSHKYEELYKEYKLEKGILPIENLNETLKIIDDYLNEERNQEIRNLLKKQFAYQQQRTKDMWRDIWNYKM